jgi:uncharacterized protein YdeI (YjbR/CyaY-like superfamily)
MGEPRFFRTAAEWRQWLEENHATAIEQAVGFHKAGSGRTGITRKEALDEALCFGWIDGVARGIDEHAWQIRFTPRQRRSVWSDVNMRRVEELRAEGRMAPAGLAAYERRDPRLQKRYSGENRHVVLDAAYEARFRANRTAWAWFEARPMSYRHPAVWWVMSAVKAETRDKRLAQLIADSEAGQTIKPLTPRPKPRAKKE